MQTNFDIIMMLH